jgi:hypothetical protein
MTNQESPFTEKESILLIEQMINNAKRNFQDNSFHFLLWGWLVLLAAVTEYILLNFVNYSYHFIVWPIIMPLGGITAAIYGYMQGKKSTVKTYTDQFMGYLWTAFIISLLMIIFFGSKIGHASYPIIIILYGIGTFVSGGAMKFKPLIYGGICCWIIAGIAFFASFSNQLLLLSLSLLVSYIIPGHILKANKNGRV